MRQFRVIELTDRYDACVAFYTALGGTVVGGWDDHGRGRIFQVEGTDGCVEVIEVGPGEAQPAGAGIAVEVDDVAAQRAGVLAAGISAPELEDQPWGHRSYAVTDPAGLSVTFFQAIGRSDPA